MGILAPLALAALPLLGLILALYLLKLRRPMAPVASLHLWDSLTRDREANSLWQRLRVSLLLILQLLALLVLILALARPWLSTSEPVGQHVIIIVDVSASMASADADERGNKTRIDAARDQADSIVDNLPQDGTATLITSDAHASVVVPATADRARLREAIGRLRPQVADTDISEAIKLASVMAARQSNSSVWVLSDGVFPSVKDNIGSLQAELHFVQLGRGAANQGITALSLEQRAGTLQLFAQVVNSDNVTVTRRLDLTVDDVPWTARTLSLAPGTTQQLILDDVPLAARVVQAALSGQDKLDLDDRAWTVNRASAPANVLMVTSGNKFLELALSLLPSVTLYKVAPGDYKPSDKINGLPVDLTIFDAGTSADTLKHPPPGNLLMIAPEISNPVITVTGIITEPVPSTTAADNTDSSSSTADQGSRDPLLRFVEMAPVHISKAVHLETPAWGRTILSSDKGPLIVAGESQNRKLAALAFDLHDSDLPLQTAFPLLMRNLITYLLPDPTGGLPAEVSPGAPVGIEALSSQVDKIVVEDPTARELSYPVKAGQGRVAFAETAQPGVYYVSQYAGGQLIGQEAFAVNLFSRDESMITPNQSPGLPTAQTAASTTSAAGQQGFKRELWPLVALLGFLLLIIEWVYAQRIAIRRALTEWQTRRYVKRET